MRAIVDKDTCTGCGLCIELCPEVFEMGETTARAKEGIVPSEVEAFCRKAVESCPVEAISVEE